MFERLPGFRDFYPEDCARRNYLFRVWAQTAVRFGFVEYDAPALEPLDLFTEKSGPEIVSQLFNFTDKGGREVTLRPELTPSLARLVGAKGNSLKRPIKWFNIGENYRYEKQQKGRLRSFYQLNVDVLGEAGPGADAEIIALYIETLRNFGLTSDDVCVRLSDRDLWMAYLAALGHEGEAAFGILGVIDKRERMSREALAEKLSPWFNDATDEFVAQLDAIVSIRDFEELKAFFLTLAPTGGIRDRIARRLEDWARLIESLEAFGVKPFLRLDLGIVRGLAYYTGFVFEVFEREGDELVGRALAGGGRYDHLIEKLGYPAMPAVGCGCGDVTLADLLDKKGLFPEMVMSPDVYVVIGGEAETVPALEAVAVLRRAGISVEYALKPTGFGKQFKTAGQSGARLTLVFGSEEVAGQVVKIKDMRSGGELIVPALQLNESVRAVLEEGIPR